MNLMVAVDRNWAIGKKGQLLITIPGDQKLFREETMGKVLVMGRKTFESLPGGQPLYGRTNLVLTQTPGYQVKGAKVFSDMNQILKYLEGYKKEDIFIVGGQSIYEQFLPFCDVAHVTYIDYAYDADTYFPNLEEHEEWKQVAASDEQTYFDLCYEFRMYQRKKIEVVTEERRW